MIKLGLKNYFVNLKHFFTPIGTLAVGMFIGLSILIPGALAIISALVERIAEILQSATFDFSTLKDAVLDAIRALDWNDPFTALKIMLSREWLSGVINECLNVVANGLQPYADAISSAVNDAVSGIVMLVVLFVFLCVLGLIGGYFLTRCLVRRTMAKRTFRKFLFSVLVDSVVTAALIAFSVWIMIIWTPGAVIMPIVSLLVFGCSSLVSAYLVHGRKRVRFGKILTFGNIFKLLLINTIIFIISVLFLFLTVLITNPIAGILIGFSFVEIAFLVMSMNAESYVIKLVSQSAPSDIQPLDFAGEQPSPVEEKAEAQPAAEFPTDVA